MDHEQDKNERILRLKQVKARTGISRATIYIRVKAGTFPKQVCLGPRSVGWLESEVDAWIQNCINNRV